MNIDPEVALIAWLKAQLDGIRGVTILPAALETRLPLFHVGHIGGADEMPSLSALTIDVDYYAGAKAEASSLARAGHSAIRYRLRGTTLTTADGSAVVTRVAPSFLPRPDDTYGNLAVHRYLSSYSISFKMRAASAA